MEKLRLGKTEMMVSKVGFGGVPVQRVSDDEAAAVIRRCLELGINYFDTAAEYTNCEGRIGRAIKGQRDGLIIATKSDCLPPLEIEKNLQNSLKQLGVDSIDLYQYHGIDDFDTYGMAIDPNGPLAVLQEAQRNGLIKHIGITSHQIDIAKEAVKSGIFETIMFPFNFVACEQGEELLSLTRENDVGFIAMKPLAGAMLGNVNICFKYLFQFPDVVSIPGIQSVEEIEEIVGLLDGNWQMTEAERSEMQGLKKELDIVICRRCGYCKPCPVDIPLDLMLTVKCIFVNLPSHQVFSEPFVSLIRKTADCTRCGDCEERCPYHMPIMQMIADNLETYEQAKKEYEKELT